MPVLMTMRAPGTTEMYDRVDAELNVESNLPQGLIAHYAASTGDEVIVFDIWESREDFERFAQERLMPAMQKVMGEPPPSAEPTFAELHNEIHP